MHQPHARYRTIRPYGSTAYGIGRDFRPARLPGPPAFRGLYRQRWQALEQFSTLPLELRRRLDEAGYRVGQPQVEKRFVSTDGTVRYLLAFADGQSVETVWMPEGDGGEAGDGSETAKPSWRSSIPLTLSSLP